MTAQTAPPTWTTLRFMRCLVGYRPGLFAGNLAMWGLVHLTPVLFPVLIAELLDGLTGDAAKKARGFVTQLYAAYESSDASLAEINPLLVTPSGTVLAVDAKLDVDDNALFRHPDLAAMRHEFEEDPLEAEAGKSNLNYVKLDGNVGCMVNGAGLAMGTMDLIKLAGGEPATPFLRYGDCVRIEMRDAKGKSIFGAIEQRIEPHTR